MSDWRSRAQPVPVPDAGAAPVANWRARAVPAEEAAAREKYGSSYVGSALPGESLEAAAKRLGGVYQPPEVADAENAATTAQLKKDINSHANAAAQGATFNLADEGQAAWDTAGDALGNPSALKEHPLDYLRQRYVANQQVRQDAAKADTAAHPGMYLAGALLAPNPAAKAGLAGRLAGYAGQGALAGFGGSDASVVGGEGKQAALDALKGGGVGLALGAAGEGLMAGGRALSGRLAKEFEGAADALNAKNQAAVEKEVTLALSKYRSSVQSASRDLEVIEREAAGGGPLAAQARAFLQTPEAAALKEQVLKNKLATAPERISEMDAMRKTFQDLDLNKLKEIATRNLTQFESAPGRFWEGLKRSVGQRAALGAAGAAAGAGLSALTGNDPMKGGGLGAGLGYIAPGALQFARNQANSPALQAQALQAVGRALDAGNRAVPQALTAGVRASGESASDILDWLTGHPPSQEKQLKALAAALRRQGVAPRPPPQEP